ncbi:MAG: RluA family pseudouridine synthase [Deltaproteobacteria bacterium]|nr:MAG: RluA family pseudouridine synthase [Deltaproteobacteria bacterium]
MLTARSAAPSTACAPASSAGFKCRSEAAPWRARLVQLIIDENNAGRRVDSVLRRLCASTPLGPLMRLIRVGAVRLNGRRCRGGTRLRLHDTLQLAAGAVSQASAAPQPSLASLPPLEPLYEDADVLVVDKPAGLACHPGTARGDDHLMARVAQHLGPAQVGQAPGLCQRLDAGVSGLLVVGKQARALRRLSADVEQGRILKRYVAIVAGRVAAPAGRIDMPLRVTDQPMGNRPRTLADPDHGALAVTDFRRLAVGTDCSVLCLRLHTGRTHQIRAHLRHLGHPLLGDARYGDAQRNARLLATFGLRHPALHAAVLRFVHPISGRRMSFATPLPQILRRLAPRC